MSEKLPSIVVTGYDGAGRILTSSRVGRVTAVISLGDPYAHPCDGFSEFPGPKLRLQFDDVERDLPMIGRMGCTWSDIQKMVLFYEKVPHAGTTLIHCAAGISRSSAAALGLLTYRIGDPRLAIDMLLENIELAREQGLRSEDEIWPNRRVVWMLDFLLQSKNSLIEAHQSRWLSGGSFEVPEYP